MSQLPECFLIDCVCVCLCLTYEVAFFFSFFIHIFQFSLHSDLYSTAIPGCLCICVSLFLTEDTVFTTLMSLQVTAFRSNRKIITNMHFIRHQYIININCYKNSRFTSMSVWILDTLIIPAELMIMVTYRNGTFSATKQQKH